MKPNEQAHNYGASLEHLEATSTLFLLNKFSSHLSS